MAQQACPYCGVAPARDSGGEPFWCAQCKRIISPGEAAPSNPEPPADVDVASSDPGAAMSPEPPVSGDAVAQEPASLPPLLEDAPETPDTDSVRREEAEKIAEALPSMDELLDESEFSFIGDVGEQPEEKAPSADIGRLVEMEEAAPETPELPAEPAPAQEPKTERAAEVSQDESAQEANVEGLSIDQVEEVLPEPAGDSFFGEFAAHAEQVEEALAEVYASLNDLEELTRALESEREVLREDLRIVREEAAALPGRMTSGGGASGEQPQDNVAEPGAAPKAGDEVDPGLSAMIESFMRFTGRD